MTAKSNKGVRLETDIEKCREESNWKKVIELSDQLKQKHNSQGLFSPERSTASLLAKL